MCLCMFKLWPEIGCNTSCGLTARIMLIVDGCVRIVQKWNIEDRCITCLVVWVVGSPCQLFKGLDINQEVPTLIHRERRPIGRYVAIGDRLQPCFLLCRQA